MIPLRFIFHHLDFLCISCQNLFFFGFLTKICIFLGVSGQHFDSSGFYCHYLVFFLDFLPRSFFSWVFWHQLLFWICIFRTLVKSWFFLDFLITSRIFLIFSQDLFYIGFLARIFTRFFGLDLLYLWFFRHYLEFSMISCQDLFFLGSIDSILFFFQRTLLLRTGFFLDFLRKSSFLFEFLPRSGVYLSFSPSSWFQEDIFLRSRFVWASLTTKCFLVFWTTSWMFLDFLPRSGFLWDILPGSRFFKEFLQKSWFFKKCLLRIWFLLDFLITWWCFADFSPHFGFLQGFLVVKTLILFEFCHHHHFFFDIFCTIIFSDFLLRTWFLLDLAKNLIPLWFLDKVLFFLGILAKTLIPLGFVVTILIIFRFMPRYWFLLGFLTTCFFS